MKKKSVKRTGKAKYEMNLAEFPVTVLSKRVSEDKKSHKVYRLDNWQERKKRTARVDSDRFSRVGATHRLCFKDSF